MGILGGLGSKRGPAKEYRTVDGGHPAPFPDMTDEQLYNYEIAFNVPNKTFENRPGAAAAETAGEDGQDAFLSEQEGDGDAPRYTMRATRPLQEPAAEQASLPPLDLSKPVRLITTKQPVEIITTRARHPLYKVHGYIGDDNVVTVFTLDGRLSENGLRYLENVPQGAQLYLNIYPNPDLYSREKYLLTQHETREAADAAAHPGRIACTAVQFDT